MTAMGGRVEMLTVASVGDCCLDTRGEAKPSAAAAAARTDLYGWKWSAAMLLDCSAVGGSVGVM